MNFSATKEFRYFFVIALGAIPGALLRWGLNNDFLVNILGAALLGFIAASNINRSTKLLLGVGFCGSLTTFSGLTVKFAQYLLAGSLGQGFVLIIYTLTFALLAASIGFFLGKKIR